MSEQTQDIDEQGQPSSLTFAQLVGRVHRNYERFLHAELAYNRLRTAVEEPSQAPVFEMPTGTRDKNGEPVRVPLDLNHVFRTLDIRDPDKQKEMAREMLASWANFFAEEFKKSLRQLVESGNECVTRMEKHSG